MATWTPVRTGARTRSTGAPGAIASLAAAVFTIVVTAFAFLVAAAILLPAPGDAGAGIVAVTSPLPAVSPTTPGGSAAPRATQAPTAAPAAVVATLTPSPTAAPRLARIRASAPVVVDGRPVGRVTVQALRVATKPGVQVEVDERVLVATVLLTATSRLPYDAAHWQLEDEAGDRWDPLGDAPTKPLGAGTLAPAGARTGSVAFVVPRDRTVRSVILTDGAGTDLVVFSRPQPST